MQKGGWCQAVVRETRRSTRAEYQERQRLLQEKEKRDQERRTKQKLAKQKLAKKKVQQEVAGTDLGKSSEVQTKEENSLEQDSAGSSGASSPSGAAGVGPAPSVDPIGNSAYVDLGSEIIFEAKCHYLGWQARYDEWVVFPSKRVAVHHLHTAGTNREKLLQEKKSTKDVVERAEEEEEEQ